MNGSTPAAQPSGDGSADVLAPLGDVDGVWGSFVFSDAGELLLWDMPGDIGEAALDGAAPRLMRLREALALDDFGGGEELYMLRYAERRLCLRVSDGCVIGVVTSAAVNVPALKMAMTVTARRLDRALGGRDGRGGGA